VKKIFLHLLVFFVAAQAVALFVGQAFIAQQLSLLEHPEDPGNALTLMFFVLVSAGALLLILKFYSGALFFQAMEFGLIMFSGFMALSIVLDSTPALALGLLVAIARFLYPPVRSYLLLLSSAVAGALLGASLGAIPAIAFAVLLSVYDILAVFYTKHMIALAQGLNSRGTSFSIQITAQAQAKTSVKAGKQGKAGKHSTAVQAKKGQGTESIELGTGDIVIPAMVIVSAGKLSFLQASAALAGSIAGMLLLFYFMSKRKGYWPALPPIVLGALAALAAATLIVKPFP